MEVPSVIILTIPVNYQALEAFCANMDVVSVEIAGYPGYGFFEEGEYKAVRDFLVNNGFMFTLLQVRPTKGLTPQVPDNSPKTLGTPWYSTCFLLFFLMSVLFLVLCSIPLIGSCDFC